MKDPIEAWATILMLLLVVVLAFSCPDGSRSARYRDWWRQTAACAGEHGPNMTLPQVLIVDSIAGGYVARAEPSSRRIYVTGAYADSEWVIKHEMIHVLVGRSGHPVIPFYLCGGLHVYGYDE